MDSEVEYSWKIERIVPEAPETRSLYLRAVKERPDFIAGQYLTIKLPGLEPSEGKAYSIASAPAVPLVRITVRRIGKFSTALNSLKEGDVVVTSAPYGFFYPEPEDERPLVFVIGGVGITPAMSIITDRLGKGDERPLYLFYSNRTVADTIFKQELDTLAADHGAFTVSYFITRETAMAAGLTAGRLSAPIIIERTSSLQEPDFFICGSIPFTRDMWRGLKAVGVPQERLYTEGFF